jgi:Protein of unknown function (DUF2621)
MEWSEGAENLLTALAKMVPEALRELARLSARDEAEAVASDRSADEVDVDDAMRGWIRMTPPEQRNGLIAVIESLGLEPERYAEDLENAEGWDDEDDDEDEDEDEDEEDEEPPDSET